MQSYYQSCGNCKPDHCKAYILSNVYHLKKETRTLEQAGCIW